MEVTSVVAYQGPNIPAHFSVMRHTTDLGVPEKWPTAHLGQGFIDRLPGYLPGLQQHGCSYQTPGGFVRRMHEGEGTSLGHVMGHVVPNLSTGGTAIDVTDSVQPSAACGWREIE